MGSGPLARTTFANRRAEGFGAGPSAPLKGTAQANGRLAGIATGSLEDRKRQVELNLVPKKLQKYPLRVDQV